VRSPHFVDNEHFARGAAAADVAATRRAWGVPDHAMTVGFVGKLLRKKRPVDLLEAVATSGRRDIHVVYVGDGALREECQASADRLVVPTTFAGFHNQGSLPTAYAAIDVLVLPSDTRETWGLVVNEAMACGIPAVVSNAAGCAPDLVVEGETGYSFPVGDIRVLATRLGTLASSSELRLRLGAQSREHISAYTAEAAVAGILEAVALASWERAA
jgi:glycosyltransferase involved in cell wall biosynthesis